MKIAVAYIRVSTDAQTEYSPDSQLKLLKEYAKKNNMLLSEVYADEGISGRKADKRPAFKKMIADAKSNKFNVILIYNTSRFARNHEESIVYRNMLQREGKEVISITQPSVDYKTDILMNALYAVMDERYSIELSENVKRGMKEKASRGIYISCAPLGYVRKENNKPLVIHDAESQIIRWIFTEYVNGNSMFAMARELNAKGYRAKRGNPFDRRGILRILTNPVYKGHMSWSCDGDTINMKADHEPIIDDKTFEKVQTMIAESKKTKVRKIRDSATCAHWLAGIIRCPSCGTTYVFVKGYKGRADRFRCGNYSNAACINSHTIKIKTMEDIVLEYLANIPIDDIIFTKNNDAAFELENKAKSSVAQLEKALERAKQAFLQGIDTLEEYRINKETITREIDIAKCDIANIEQENTKAELSNNKIQNLLDILRSSNENRIKNTFMRSVVNKIVARPEENSFDFYFFG